MFEAHCVKLNVPSFSVPHHSGNALANDDWLITNLDPFVPLSCHASPSYLYGCVSITVLPHCITSPSSSESESTSIIHRKMKPSPVFREHDDRYWYLTVDRRCHFTKEHVLQYDALGALLAIIMCKSTPVVLPLSVFPEHHNVRAVKESAQPRKRCEKMPSDLLFSYEDSGEDDSKAVQLYACDHGKARPTSSFILEEYKDSVIYPSKRGFLPSE